MQFSRKSFCFAFSFHQDQVLHAFLVGGFGKRTGSFFLASDRLQGLRMEVKGNVRVKVFVGFVCFFVFFTHLIVFILKVLESLCENTVSSDESTKVTR